MGSRVSGWLGEEPVFFFFAVWSFLLLGLLMTSQAARQTGK